MKYIVILILFASCSTININGVKVKNVHKRGPNSKEVACICGSIALSIYVGKNVIPTK